jgi:hypothetical protein
MNDPFSPGKSLWGTDVTIITTFDEAFFPGFCGLYNSASQNAFRGKWLVLNTSGKPLCPPVHNIQEILDDKAVHPEHTHPYLRRLLILRNLPDGRYLYMDSDVIIERPIGHLIESIKYAPLVSLEPEPKYSFNDARIVHACKCLDIDPTNLPDIEYMNAGIIGFEFPRDRPLIEKYVAKSLAIIKPGAQIFSDPDFPMLDQDIFNILMRDVMRSGTAPWTLSSRILEFGKSSSLFQNRTFPYPRQNSLQPIDQLKYIIHGASLPRPWLIKPAQGSIFKISEFKDLSVWLKTSGILPLWKRIQGHVYPYERAWIHYACREDHPIAMKDWIKRFPDFATAIKSPFFRKAYT